MSVAKPARTRLPGGMLAPWVVIACLVPITLIPAVAGADELTVEIVPHQARLMHGGTIQFAVEARDQGGEPVEGTVTWEVIPDRLGLMAPDGLFTAQGIGRGIVRATVTNGDLTGVGHAMIRVSPISEPVPIVVVEPRQANLMPGENAKFRVQVTDPGTGEGLSLPVEWRVVPGTLGHIGQDGSFAASDRPGTGHVVARVRHGDTQALGEARVLVGRAVPSDLVVQVTPPRSLLLTGQSRRFEAVLVGAKDSEPAPTVEWSVLPVDLGTMSPDGTLTAGPSAVDGRVVATVATRDGVIRGYASVAVREGEPYRLAVQLHPREAVTTPGSEVHFQAVVLGTDGEIPQAEVAWEVRPAGLGTISPDGVFIAASNPGGEAGSVGIVRLRQAGEIIATARHGGVTAQAKARVVVEERPAQPMWLEVRPARTKLLPGEQLQFYAELVGGENPREIDVTWSVRPEELGVITPDGLFTTSERLGDPADPSSTTREGMVIAEARLSDGRTFRGNAVVAVRREIPEPRVLIEPSSVTLRAGDVQQFRALVNDRDSQLLGYQLEWDVKWPGEIAGTITPAGELHVSPEFSSPVEVRGQVTVKIYVAPDRIYRATANVSVLPAPGIRLRER